jgi:tetratricopeptide (TPR) repeat protein
LPGIFALTAANAAYAGQSNQTLVPPPPPIAIDLGSGMSSGMDYSGIYQGAYSRLGNMYSGYGNNYSGYTNGYSPQGNAYAAINSAAAAQQAAMRQYTQSFDIDLNSSDALKQRGLYRYAMGDLVGANSDLSKALSLSPHDKQAAEALLDLWRRQVSANPMAVNGHLGLARAYLQIGDLESAQAEYRVVVKLDPENPHLPAARKCVKELLARRASQKCFESAKTMSGVGDYREAYEKASEALAYCPKDEQVMLFKARMAEKLADYPEAHKLYLAVLTEDPKNQQAEKALKILKAHKGAYLAKSAPEERSEGKVTSNLGQVSSATVASNAAVPLEAGQLRPPLTVAQNPDEVTSLANFLGSVRTLGIAQKNQAKKVEKSSQKSLKSLSLKSNSAGTAASAAPVLKAQTAQMAPLEDGSVASAFADPDMPKLAPPISTSNGPRKNFKHSASSAQSALVSMELQKVALSGTGVTLSVLLKNNSDQPLALPAQVKVAVKAPGKPEKMVRGRFLSSTVAPQEAVKGVIKLPENEFSPSTDIFLPNFHANGIAQGDLHLSIPVASL